MKTNITTNILNVIKIAVLAVVLSLGLSYVYAWTAPTAVPPTGNVSAPINTSLTGQIKLGDFTARFLSANSITFPDGTTQGTYVPHGKKLFGSSGTFIVPAGVAKVWVSMSGGGGGGAGYGGSGGNGGDSNITELFYIPTGGGSGGTATAGGVGGFGPLVGGKGVTHAYLTSVCLAQGGGNIFGSGGPSSTSGNLYGGVGNGYGGGGGGYARSTTLCGGGGGAGGAMMVQEVPVTPNQTLSVVVGAAGAAGSDGGFGIGNGGAPGARGFVLIEW